ncbi:uncharacterized protein LOC132755385 [Ruditapes philippinarum]|uniref:uncharacterized protein LOC132755385 n=1 Tax=Ruditapes philippinarum TaxID=129788 RepID=UPI00295B8E19|nr:uncharacterized protein LOC132755385 [Ruditapes philippinarum]
MEEKNVKDTLAENTYNFKLSKCTLKTLVVVAIFKMIVLLTVVVYWRILREHKVVHVLEWCSELDIASQGNPGLLGQLIVKTDKNTNRNKACGKLNTMLKTVVNMNIQDSYDSDACPEIIDLDIKAFNCTVAKKVESTLRLNYITSQAKPGMFETFEID